MKYEEFVMDVKRGIEEIVKERLEDALVIIRNVMKNNGVSVKAVSILKKGEYATPTIYLKEYFRQYKAGRSMESICEEIFEMYLEGIENFRKYVTFCNFTDFKDVKQKIFYKIINYEMNERLLSEVPHFKFLDMAIIFFVMVNCDEHGQATALIYNQHVENWKVSREELRSVAFSNTWREYPAVIRKMEDIISEMILEEILKEGDEDEYDDFEDLREEIRYGSFTYEDVVQAVREEVASLKANREIEMYVLTNTIRFNGAACMTYPGVIKKFAQEHECDVYIIPSSIHEVILIPGTTIWRKEMIDRMVREVNVLELDPVEILADHVYIYSREAEEIFY